MSDIISVNERIDNLRNEMKKSGVDIYIVPTSDFHMSEYVSEYFQCRKYLSGFTGSAGTLIVTGENAYMYTDGRYFIQAKEELEGSSITLMRMGDAGVKKEEELIDEMCKDGGAIGFDGRVVSDIYGKKICDIAEKHGAAIMYDRDLADIVWKERPVLEFGPIYSLEEKYTGESVESKIERVRRIMKDNNTSSYVLTSLDDQAWLYNLRGSDVKCNPVFLSYSIITTDEVIIYTGSDIPKELSDDNQIRIMQKPYHSFYDDLSKITGKVMVDLSVSNYLVSRMLSGAEIVDVENPTKKMKAVKNDTELENIRKCHVWDGVAVTKFMYWLKNNVGKETITEISAAEYLEKLRREQGPLKDLSFETISAYGANAAMMHYSADEKCNVELKPEGMYLVDSGGQYFEGTTDITRTIVLGPVTEDMKKHFTLVAKGMLNLMNAVFLDGCTGTNLDILARGALWKERVDYKCGTGHGVGYMLNVHEGPNNFRWREPQNSRDKCVLEAGMVTTDEPGVYIEGEYGIRTENELICVELEENEYGKFMGFETVTYAPIDLDGIDKKYLEVSDVKMLNDYHRLVWDKVSPYLNEDERAWLKGYTKEI
ncbi:MAG: aminopeptidase P family protein [Lachnospiraceae bacterium]|nr:aminopeptidase P family protein [Lachnospiraceae bacterium]